MTESVWLNRTLQISRTFHCDKDGLHAPGRNFSRPPLELARTQFGTRINCVCLELARKPWCTIDEALAAVQVAAAHHGWGLASDWIRTRERMVQSRAAAMEVNRVWNAALSGQAFVPEVAAEMESEFG